MLFTVSRVMLCYVMDWSIKGLSLTMHGGLMILVLVQWRQSFLAFSTT